MKKTLFLVCFSIFSTLLYSDDNIIIERSPFVLRLSIDDTHYWETTIQQSPYVLNENYIQFYPGEILFVEADVIDNEIRKLTVVKEIVNEDKTIIIKFSQIPKEENERIHNFMMLEIKNPFNREMIYMADIYLFQYNRWTNTSIIPVGAGLSSYEIWPDIITAMVLHDFVLR